jgi:Lon protease-like protein
MEIPIFPLNGAVLFPGTSLPLNIFEKRYIEMVDYALSKERYIGMIQSDEKNKLYNIGCIGKIHSFSETTDGRYLISLQGTNCFKVKKDIFFQHNIHFCQR